MYEFLPSLSDPCDPAGLVFLKLQRHKLTDGYLRFVWFIIYSFNCFRVTSNFRMQQIRHYDVKDPHYFHHVPLFLK